MAIVDLTDIGDYTHPRTRAAIALLLVERALPVVPPEPREMIDEMLKRGWCWARGEGVQPEDMYQTYEEFMDGYFLQPNMPEELVDPMCLILEGVRAVLWEMYAASDRRLHPMPADLRDYDAPALKEIGPYAEKVAVLDERVAHALSNLRTQARSDRAPDLGMLRTWFEEPRR